MAEQFIFIILSIILFVIIFFKMIKKNDTSYVPILVIEALGIAIDFVFLISNRKINLFVKFLIYFMSVLLPFTIFLLEKYNFDVMINIKKITLNMYIAFGNYKKAKEKIIKLLQENPENYDLHKKLAIIYEKEGGIRKAIDEYVQCIDLNKQDYDSYYKVATLLQDLDRKQEAIEMLNSLLDKQPEYTEASIILGDLLMEEKSYKEAAMVYMDALKYNPISYDLNYNSGMVYKAAEINSLAYNAKYSLAEIALIYKDLDKAEMYFTQALDEEELSADCYYELSKINIMKGNKDLAIKYANLAVDLNSKKIAQKIEKEPLFMTIRNKISIPFNLEGKEDMPSFSTNERIAKEHLENTTDITTNMGYVGSKKSNVLQIEKEVENEKQKE